MELTLPWKRSDEKWLIDGYSGAGGDFRGFVEVNNHTGDAEEMACLIVRALDYYRRSGYSQPLWEVLGRGRQPILYSTEKPELEAGPNLDALRTLDGDPLPEYMKNMTIKTTGFRMCYEVPSWWEG